MSGLCSKSIVCVLVVLSVCTCYAVAGPYIPLDDNPELQASLNGTWRFVLNGPADEFYIPDFDDAAWENVTVPSNWEVEGFELPEYGGPDEGEGLYRRTFEVPAAWDGQRVFIRFEGVLFGFEFWINGRRAGSFESAYNRSDFDITDLIKRGETNIIAVRVYRRFPGWDFDVNDSWGLSGIYRDVELFTVPDVHIKDITIVTTVGEDLQSGNVRCTISAEQFSKEPGTSAVVTGLLTNPDGVPKSWFSKTICFDKTRTSEVDVNMAVAKPELWNAETPNLYELQVYIETDDTRHTVTSDVGIREVTVIGDVLKVNHRPVKIRGVDHHDIHPEVGRAMRAEHYRQDVELMKSGNINSIRTSHYPPHPALLDICDEYGIYLIDEVPFGKGDDNLEKPEFLDILLARADATIERDKNHPSVIIWSVGNENPITTIVVKTCEHVDELDPTRPKLLPGAQNSSGFITDLPDSVEIYAPHYPYTHAVPDRGRWGLSEAAESPDITRPILCTEYNHSLGTAFEGLKEHWELMQKTDRLAGGCIWHFQDQGLKRKTNAGVKFFTASKDRLLVNDVDGAGSADVWLDDTTVLDSHGGSGTDGIVYADRFPQSDYWLTRKVYSQIVIPTDEIKSGPGRQTIEIPVLNRYDFINLDRVKGTWRLMSDNKEVGTGTITLNVPPRTSGRISLDLNMPEDTENWLEFRFTDHHDRNVYERSVRLVPKTGIADLKNRLADGGKKRGVVLKKNGRTATVVAGDLQVVVKKGRVTISNKVTGQTLMEGPIVRVGRDPAMAEWRNYPRYDFTFWENPLLTSPKSQRPKFVTNDDGTVEVSITSEYASLDADRDGQSILADVKLTVSPKGWIDVDYELVPQNADGFFLELGLAFRMPGRTDNLTWLGDGPYNSYPGQTEAGQWGVWHIEPMPVTNPRSRYFSGNRANVELAAVTDDDGNGAGVICDRSTLSLERAGEGMVFSHLLRVAGKGNKTGGMLTLLPVPASKVKKETGHLRLVSLSSGEWPSPFNDILEDESKR